MIIDQYHQELNGKLIRFRKYILLSRQPGYALAELYDQSIASTKTKYIKLNTKTQNIFCCLNENLTTFLYTLTGPTRKQKEKGIQKLNIIKKNLGFSI